MQKITIVGFGDSLTFGYGIQKKFTYPRRLAEDLPVLYPNYTWEVLNRGINGNTTQDALMRMDDDVLAENPDIVCILFGSNDSALDDYYHRPPEVYKKNLKEILDRLQAHQNPEGALFSHPFPVLLTPPPIVDSELYPFTTLERVRQYSDLVREVAKETNCRLIDFHALLWEESGGQMAPYVQDDGVHLSNLAYESFYRIVSQALKTLLAEHQIV